MLNNYSCIVLPRIWILAKEFQKKRRITGVPRGFDGKKFITLRYRFHSYSQNKFPGKSIVDVSSVEGGIVVGNPHCVLGSQCRFGPFVNAGESLFRIQHYVGDPYVFLFRPGDTHRTLDEFNHRNGFKIVSTTDTVRDWLASLVPARVPVTELRRSIRSILSSQTGTVLRRNDDVALQRNESNREKSCWTASARSV